MYNKHNLAVAKIASKSTIKPVLACVYFTKTHTVATDSFRLLEMSVPNNVEFDEFPIFDKKVKETDSALVNADTILKMKLPKSTKLPITEHLVVQNVGDKVELITSDIKEGALNIKQVRNVEDTFPDYKQVIPTSEPKATVQVRASYLAEILSILGDLNGTELVTLELRGETEAIIVRAENDKQSGMGLVMPINH